MAGVRHAPRGWCRRVATVPLVSACPRPRFTVYRSQRLPARSGRDLLQHILSWLGRRGSTQSLLHRARAPGTKDKSHRHGRRGSGNGLFGLILFTAVTGSVAWILGDARIKNNLELQWLIQAMAGIAGGSAIGFLLLGLLPQRRVDR